MKCGIDLFDVTPEMLGLNGAGKLVTHYCRVSSVSLTEHSIWSCLLVPIVDDMFWCDFLWMALSLKLSFAMSPILWKAILLVFNIPVHHMGGMTFDQKWPSWLAAEITRKSGKVAIWNASMTTMLCGVVVLQWGYWVSNLSSCWAWCCTRETAVQYHCLRLTGASTAGVLEWHCSTCCQGCNLTALKDVDAH